MTISDLFLAILSMDSYNRGYSAGLSDSGPGDPDGLGETKGVSKVGNATVSYTIADASLDELAQAAGFYAVAYTIGTGENAETVISYRGTDDPGSELFSVDFPIIAGSYDEAQLALAVRFYQAVKAENPNANIILTGHSLGGGLAGYVA